MYNTDLPNRAELPSNKQLLRSTVIAIIVAAVLLVTIVLPAEYGVDPTRVGRVLGLTKMGEIKMTLAAEAKKVAKAEAAQRNSGQTAVVQPKQSAATENNAAIKTDEMTVTLKPGESVEIKMTLAAEAKKAAEAEAAQRNSGQTTVVQPKQNTATENNAVIKTDEMTVTLKPGESVEIKMEMSKGARVKYEWMTNGGAVNHDTHGEGASKAFISYKKGTNVMGDAGELIANFDGSHGWFWRNRSQTDVTVTLKTNGEYQNIKQVG